MTAAAQTIAAGRWAEVRAPQEQYEGTRSQILRWLKARGETVERDEPLLEIETDKVTVEIASPATGVLREMLKGAEEEIAPGELLGRIETVEADARADSAAREAQSASRAEPPSAAAGRTAAPRSERPGARPLGTELPRAASPGREPPVACSLAVPHLSPAVERLLAQHGLNSADVHGTGRGGRITVDDVLRHAAESARADRLQKHELPPPSSPPSEGKPSRRVPHSAMRKRIAEHMVRSLLQTAPHVTTVFEADFSAVLAHRARHKEEFAREGAPLTITAYLLAACVDAIRAAPEANARWTEDALEIFDTIDIGVGTALPDRGLIVPVVRNVAALGLLEIARELGRLVELAREDRLGPADVRGGTFTISNHGVSGSVLAAPIVIPQPQTAILGVGRVEKRPVVVEESGAERIVVRPRAYLTLTIDHRAMDGQDANRFLEVLVRRLETWAES